MDIKRFVRIVVLYFLPVVLIHMIFAILDQNLQNQLLDIKIITQKRLNLMNIAVCFYFLVIPLYLTLANFIFSVNANYYLYKHEIKFVYLSIFIENIIVFIYNLVNLYKFNDLDLSPFLEFILVFIPQGISLGLFLSLGYLLIKSSTIRDAFKRSI